MSSPRIRVRFAPSPTGGLHIGGVRTVLFNYLFAKQHNGDFIVRIEDTDQSRFVAGAEAYIFDTLKWCGLEPDESPVHGGAFGPYRQSERKDTYHQYALQLVKQGNAYYAFDTPAELEARRASTPNFQYDHTARLSMKNSLTLPPEETERLLHAGTHYVIRIKMPQGEEIRFTDMIRGHVQFHSSQSDDKVLLKADGMPTYHLAVVVDDHLMKISHAFRGEEWLPSAPVHILLWRWLFGEENMPAWAHLPLILKPDGNGKLSKRDGDRLGFPVFAMDWTDPKTGTVTQGFREKGFLPEAFNNMLALLGWNDGTDKEIFSLKELVKAFSMERVHKGGARFDYEKAKWFNHEWIKRWGTESDEWQGPGLEELVADVLKQGGVIVADRVKLKRAITLVKDRCTFLSDFLPQSRFLFQAPVEIDAAAVKPKWDDKKKMFFVELIRAFELMQGWQAEQLEQELKELAAANQLKPGELMLPFRIMLVGAKFGPGVFDVASFIGKDETLRRIKTTMELLM